MGFVGSMLGGGASGGNNFQAAGPTQNQINESYNQVQDQLKNQQSLIDQLTAQNGIANQSQVYNQLQGVASGQGPNPAQAMLANQTGNNIASQAALMAGQRGAGSNVGLMARQAAQQGGALQQQATGQGAQLQAQQSLGALGQAGGLATSQVNQQQQAQQAELQGALGQQSSQLGARAAANQTNASMAQASMQQQSALAGGLLSGVGMAAMMLARGGEVPKYADGGDTLLADINSMSAPQSSSFLNKMKSGAMASFAKDPMNLGNGAGIFGAGMTSLASKGAGKLGSMFKPASPQVVAGGPMDNVGPSVDNPDVMNAAYGAAIDMRSGGHVPGKARVAGDNLKNDTQPAMLSPKEIVLPRSITMHPDAPNKAAEFVQAILAKKGLRK